MTPTDQSPRFGSLEGLRQGPPQQWLRVTLATAGIVLALASVFTTAFWTVYIAIALLGVWIMYPLAERRRRRPRLR